MWETIAPGKISAAGKNASLLLINMLIHGAYECDTAHIQIRAENPFQKVDMRLQDLKLSVQIFFFNFGKISFRRKTTIDFNGLFR